MKIAIFDDNFLSNFRLDDGGLTLVLKDKTECTRAVELKPIEDYRPTLIYKGQVVYLTDEHLEVLAEWEREEMKKEVLEQFKKTIDGLSDFDWQTEMRKDYADVIADLKGKPISGTVYQDSFCPYAYNCIEYVGSHCADRCPLRKENEE